MLEGDECECCGVRKADLQALLQFVDIHIPASIPLSAPINQAHERVCKVVDYPPLETL